MKLAPPKSKLSSPSAAAPVVPIRDDIEIASAADTRLADQDGREAAIANTAPAQPERDGEAISAAVEHACALVPPLWTLRNFVAVNPFMGMSSKPFGEAVVEIDRIKHGDPLWPADHYRAFFEQGRIAAVDLDEAVSNAPLALGRPELANVAPSFITDMLCGHGPSHARVLTYAEAVDAEEGTDWNEIIVDEIARWCAGRFDAGQSSWPQPGMELPLYPAWRALAMLDRSAEVRGLAGFRAFAASLPERAEDCIEQLVAELALPASALHDVLARALASVSGWAGHIQYRVRQAEMDGEVTDESLVDLLAIRLAFDAALHRLRTGQGRAEGWPTHIPERDEASAIGIGELESDVDALLSDLEIRHIWQLALESAYRRDLLARLTAPGRHLRVVRSEPQLQAVFCIDVRSEVLRRHLEGQSDRIGTVGFAGFFGLPIASARAGDDASEARCPALLSPGLHVSAREDAVPAHVEARGQRERFHSVFKQLRLSSVSAFPFVETVGQMFGLRLVTDSLGWTRPGADSRLLSDPKAGGFDPVFDFELPGGEASEAGLDELVGMAEGMLRNMGLTEGLAPYVLFCGHGSSTTNNPYASALDCGACGGYSGDINARAAASLLNHPEVRRGLESRGMGVPEHTRFLAGMHDTTTDEITLFDTGSIPPEELAEIRSWLDGASSATREERAKRLGEDALANPKRGLLGRSRDWSELRPEWGLAGNAAFIAAPRDRTIGLDLGGRCFLHDYHTDRDPEGRVLELIMTAPLVVASWINLQYYASTVDNEVFGSGTKTVHNVVGRHGVVAGNGGDLRVGLPFQSVHDGEKYVHEPLRLTAVIEAPNERISGILERHGQLRQLVENQWIHLISIDPDGAGLFRWTPNGFQGMGDGVKAGRRE
jgi:hypothetical protein